MIFLESYTIIESENVIFFEHLFHLKNKEKVLHESIDTSNDLIDDMQELKRSNLGRKRVTVMISLPILLKVNQ